MNHPVPRSKGETSLLKDQTKSLAPPAGKSGDSNQIQGFQIMLRGTVNERTKNSQCLPLSLSSREPECDESRDRERERQRQKREKEKRKRETETERGKEKTKREKREGKREVLRSESRGSCSRPLLSDLLGPVFFTLYFMQRHGKEIEGAGIERERK